MDAPWRGLQAGKQQEKNKFASHNGRANIAWQTGFLDQDNDLVMDRFPYPFIEMNPEDMDFLDIKERDLVEVYNDAGATQAMAYPTLTARKGETFMMFGWPTGPQGNVASAGVNELILPNYKKTWGNIRKIATAPASVAHLTFKSKEYSATQ